MKPLLFASLLLLSGGMFYSSAADSEPEDEVPCGPGVVTIGDAWEFIAGERLRMKALLADGDLSVWPQRIAAISAHVNFIRNKAYFVFGEPRTKLEGVAQRVREARLSNSALDPGADRVTLADNWRSVEQDLDAIPALLPEGSLVSSSEMAHLLPPALPTVKLQFNPLPVLKTGHVASLVFSAEQSTQQGLSDLLGEQILESHGARMHAFIVSEDLEDYHHLHPQAGDAPGRYVVDFTPKAHGRYRCWINLVPTASGREEFPYVDLQKSENALLVPMERRRLSNRVASEGMRAELLGMEQIRTNTLTPGTIRLVDDAGNSVSDLEPYMGAFAHIVGIHEDFQTILHLHPHGAVPKAGERGGPSIDFTMRAPRPGYYRLFVQVQRQGRVILLPFGISAK